jgi:hypothetical protein
MATFRYVAWTQSSSLGNPRSGTGEEAETATATTSTTTELERKPFSYEKFGVRFVVLWKAEWYSDKFTRRNAIIVTSYKPKPFIVEKICAQGGYRSRL